MKFKDISGQRFGRLTALYKLHNHNSRTRWLCLCECGNLKEVDTCHLTGYKIKSCGCLHVEANRKQGKRNIKHGKINTRLYRIWRCMKNRCYNKSDEHYKWYGARGIAVCDEWKDDFMSFYDWSMNNGYDDNLTIDRIDVNGNYEPNNCRWANAKQQQRNRRNNKRITYKGVTKSLIEWCETLGLKYDTIINRINKLHWTIERALEEK